MAKVTQVKPEHRCKKCKTPLQFDCNDLYTEEERERLWKTLPWWKKLLRSSHFTFVVNTNRQHWHCPKCFEEYIIELEDSKKNPWYDKDIVSEARTGVDD